MSWSEARLLEWLGRDAARRDDAARWGAFDASGWAVVETAIDAIPLLTAERAGSEGRQLGAQALSRFAEQGGSPCWALCALAAPRSASEEALRAYLSALESRLREGGVHLVGGDLSRAEQLVATVTVGGRMPEAKWCLELDGAEGECALCCDQLIEGVHFVPETPARFLGRKLGARCLSDLAATGAAPRWGRAALAIPQETDPERVRSFVEGLELELRHFGAETVDVERVACDSRWVSSLAIGGLVLGRGARRSGAEVGEKLYTTGPLGGSRLGRHLHFEPRVREGLRLVGEFDVHTMMDLSDGLSVDLPRLCEASGVGARIEERCVPLHEDANLAASESGRSVLDHALSDGEDHELLFASARGEEEFRAAGLEVYRIGEIVPAGERVSLIDPDGRSRTLEPTGWLLGGDDSDV